MTQSTLDLLFTGSIYTICGLLIIVYTGTFSIVLHDSLTFCNAMHSFHTSYQVDIQTNTKGALQKGNKMGMVKIGTVYMWSTFVSDSLPQFSPFVFYSFISFYKRSAFV